LASPATCAGLPETSRRALKTTPPEPDTTDGVVTKLDRNGRLVRSTALDGAD
jgi:hypothetical protein